ncbi:MAG TPA: cellulase family glycosylhydrolase [Micropepsaceae bacterium]|nr:cellulase family glycosylhydrolase [Micropepsaceae bacterium]
MSLPRLEIDGHWFREPSGRRLLLRGVNLGGDCKVPFANGTTNIPTDFSDHREVSFVGRPFPLAEADEHLGRLRHWGFNVLRLLTTWEAVEHKGPGQYDTDYLDYLEAVCRKAGEYGFYVFIDFHQDAWSRMSGGDGAPGWTFDAVGLDFTKFHAADAVNVMQYRYDPKRGGRQEENYAQMSWGWNYRMPANAIMWTLFFAGRTFTPHFNVGGTNVEDYLQSHYLGAMRAVAERVKDMDHVLGFDTLNEPGSGWSGKAMSWQHTHKTPEHPERVTPGPAWSPLDGLLVARGQAREVPFVQFDINKMAMAVARNDLVNQKRTSIWRAGASCPFEAAGAYRLENGVPRDVREDFFTHTKGRKLDHEHDFMLPFFNRVAGTIRAVNPRFMVFAELDPFKGHTEGFPKGMPARTVNASHWYDIVTLVTKVFMYPASLNPFNGKMLNGRGEIGAHFRSQLATIKGASDSLGGAPTLIGEFGIPYDLDNAASYDAWKRGDRSAAPWEKHVTALDTTYDVFDELLLHGTQWNYTASNRNDAAIGDGWNQEDLSIFSRDQQDDPANPDSGGRAVDGFCRPFVRAAQGTLAAMRFDSASGAFEAVIDADPAIAAPTEIYLPRRRYPHGVRVSAGEAAVAHDPAAQLVRVTAKHKGTLAIRILPG